MHALLIVAPDSCGALPATGVVFFANHPGLVDTGALELCKQV
jgi:hypothetical protein